jgi:dihydroflavonol-4-reductase
VTTLVTGATGFLGGHLVRELIGRGEQVRALARPTSDVRELVELGVEISPGDLSDSFALAKAADGCDRVFHLAGLVTHDRRRRDELNTINVDGTRRVLEAVEPGARVVYVSSVAAVGPASALDRPATEDQPFPKQAIGLPYADSKRAAEAVVAEAVARGVDVVIANPGFLIGPGDVYKVSTWPLAAYLAGKLRFSTDGALSFTDARDVAAALPVLADRGRTGERTILANRDGNASWSDFFARIAAVSGVKRMVIKFPPPIAIASATVVPWPVRADEVRAAAHWWVYDPAKAERELDFRPRGLDEAIEATIADQKLLAP